jgi:cyclopropane fatty-acyl-phospholipid synthase-like methyltransferase
MDARQYSPSTARNREAILAVLQRVLPNEGRVLELAAGSGEHAVFFAAAMPGLHWQPSDPDQGAGASIAAWTAAEALSNVAAPRDIDVCAEEWGAGEGYDAVLAINMIHISPWEATLGLMAGAARVLKPGGALFTYGAYKRNGAHTAPSNEEFEQWLQSRDPRFGVRDIADVEVAANAHGLALCEILDMPANNFSLVFRASAA